MARSLASKPNVIPPGGDYPFGRVQDDNGTGNGTPVSEQVHGDFHQFFAKLLADAGITANGQPENAADGFQYNEAINRVLLTNQYVGNLNSISKDSFLFADTGSTNLPSGVTQGFVITRIFGEDASCQIVLDNNADKLFIRRKNAGTWQTWIEIPSKADVLRNAPYALLTDLNTYEVGTIQFCNFNSPNAPTSASPGGPTFQVITTRGINAGDKWQSAVQLSGTGGAGTGTVYVRQYNSVSSTWSAWSFKS